MIDLSHQLDLSWDLLTSASESRETERRLCTLATTGPDGPEARTVVLRSAERHLARVLVYTDLRSDKIAHLTADPRASICYWDAESALQIRLRCNVEIETGAAAEPFWLGLNDKARLSYGGPGPGRKITTPVARPSKGERSAFAALLMNVVEMDVVWLGPEIHTRSLFRASDRWSGEWQSP